MRQLLSIMLLCLAPGVLFGQEAAVPVDATDQAVPGAPRTEYNGPGTLATEDIIVMPEIAQVVQLSNTAFNRIRCQGVIQDVVASDEKVLDVRYSENDAFVKFKYIVRNGKAVYASKPVELSVVCAGDVFNVVAIPRSLPVSPRISLSTGRKKQIEQNADLFAGLSHEKKCRRFVELVYKDDIPPSFDRSYPNRSFKMFKNLGLRLQTIVTAAGEGLRLKEFHVTNTGEQLLRLKESEFLKTEITSKPVFIALSKLNVKPGETSRLFIVEQTGGEND